MTNDGAIIIDKPAGMTSFDVVAKARRLFNTKKIGHTGTLDPMATGVLVVLVGRAAKAAEYIVSDDKKYTARLKLGYVSDTGDSTGDIKKTDAELPSEAAFLAALDSFRGEITQIPPMYSAIKVGGRKLVDLARKGIEIERQPRNITVFSLSARALAEGEYELIIHCSKGTYIRTICTDIGERLGCGAVMTALRRTAAGDFTLESSHKLDELFGMSEEERRALLIQTECLFPALPSIFLDGFFERLARDGNEIYLEKIGLSYPVGSRVKMYGSGRFFALGEVREYEKGLAVKPVKMFEI